MKNLVVFSVLAFAVNAMAIEFITEEQVAAQLGAQKVVEVTKYNVQTLIPRNSACNTNFFSRSARTYIVKKGNDAFLYLTPSGLNGLVPCSNLSR